MGIPYFSYYIKKTYPEVFQKSIKKNIDILCLDFNGMIYNSVHKICQLYNQNLESLIIKDILEETEKLLKFIGAKQTYIAIDGVAPRSKMIQQRNRRYMSNLNKKNNSFDTNCITPGTNFMKLLNQALKTKFNHNIIISDSSQEGEGEHKIIRFLSQFKNKTIIINGLDADLIILAFSIAQKNQVYIRREKENGTDYIAGHHLIQLLSQQAPIEDLILIFSLLGNDFVPEIKAVNNHGEMKCDKIFQAYKKYRKTGNVLICNNFINVKNFTLFISCLKDLESIDFPDEKINSYYRYYQIYDRQRLVKNYFKTLTWIMYYYLDARPCPSWNFFYNYKISPFIKDIIIYSKYIQKEDWLKIDYWYKDTSFHPYHQLLLVLPYDSLELIPNFYLVNLAKSVFKCFYPHTFQIDIMDQGKPYWMQKIFLPDFDENYIKELVSLFI